MRRGTCSALALLIAFVFTVGSSTAATAAGRQILPHEMRGRSALRALGNGLPAAAAAQGTTAAALARVLRTDRTAWLDVHGRLFYVEQTPAAEPPEEGPLPIQSGAAGPSGYTATGVPIFHSLPGATNVLYLDFDGATISGTAWNVNNVDPFVAMPFDRDGDPTTFSDDERSQITGTWLRVAEDYAPFGVDVTTEQPASFGPTTGTALITMMYDANGNLLPHADTAGGIAYVNVFGRADYPTYYSPAFVYADQLFSAEYNIAEAVSHEFGHNVGLHHDGTSTAAYYTGAGTSAQATSWAPIMGSAYYKNVTKFNNGDYPDANNHEDDLAIVGSKLGRVADDVGATPGTAAGLTETNTTVSGVGLVNDSTDQDLWGFQTAGGAVNVIVSPFVRGYGTTGGDLDVKATLVDPGGVLLASGGALDRTDATLSATVPAGTYFVRVAADASSYSSIYGSEGQYTISGSIPGSATAPSASLEVAPSITLGSGSSTFDVAFFDLDGVNVGSIGNGDVRVTGPGGFSQQAGFVKVNGAPSGSVSRIATYRVSAPGGTWDSPDNGTYTISLNAYEVTDTLGNAAPAGQVGTFVAALQRKVLYNATMATSPGWTLSSTWAYGVPTATSGPTDRPVVGDTITGTGLYAEGIREATATTPTFSTSGMSSVTFTADSMLGVRSDDVASIDVGVGTKWTTIWSNNGQNVIDGSWTTRTFDISSLAANKASVQLRFVLGPTKTAPAKVTTVSFGWNVGALQVTGR
jgi:hypothetical protein